MSNSAAAQNTAAAAAESQGGLLDQIVEQSRVAKSTAEHDRAKDIIGELVREVMKAPWWCPTTCRPCWMRASPSWTA